MSGKQAKEEVAKEYRSQKRERNTDGADPKTKMADSGIPVLFYNGPTNYREWINTTVPILVQKYGRIGNTLKTLKKAIVEPAVTYTGKVLSVENAEELGIDKQTMAAYNIYIQRQDHYAQFLSIPASKKKSKSDRGQSEAEKQYSVEESAVIEYSGEIRNVIATIERMDNKAVDNRYKLISDMRQNEEKCFAAVIRGLSPESLQAVINDFDSYDSYDKMVDSTNLLELARRIAKTHRTTNSGVQVLDKTDLLQSYFKLRQNNGEIISEYYRRTAQTIQAIEAAGLTAPSDDIQAAQFISGLNTTYSELKVLLRNNVAARTEEFPKDLLKAYERARGLRFSRFDWTTKRGLPRGSVHDWYW